MKTASRTAPTSRRCITEAVELCAYLCKQFGLTEKDIICHSEGYKRGIASNHGDVMHWFPKHGKSMDTFRADVKALLAKDAPTEQPEQTPQVTTGEITVGTVVQFKDSAQHLQSYHARPSPVG